MKILIYGMQFKPDKIGIGKYTGEMADWLHKHNHDIRVITAPHYYPEWRQQSRQWWWKKEKNPYIVWRCPIVVPSQPRGLTRLIHLLSFTLSSFPILLKNIFWKPDYIITIEPPFFIAPQTIFYSKVTNAKSILHIQDLEIDAAYSLDILKTDLLLRIVRKFEPFILSKFDVVSTISTQMMKIIVRKGVPEECLHLLPNWADTKNTHPNVESDYLRRRFLQNSSKKIILYSGNIGEKQNLKSVVEVAEKIQNDKNNCIFLISGDGAYKKRMESEAKNRKLNNIKFLPIQPDDDFTALLTLADLHLVPQNKNISDYVLPSKLTNIFSAGGVAIIAANPSTELSKLVEKHDVGYLISPDSVDELQHAINYLLTDKSVHSKISKNARLYAEKHLSKDAILSNFNKTVLI